MVDVRPLRIVFFGTPDFAVPTLDALLHSRHTVVGVVTRADRPRGRGQKTSEPPVKSAAVAAAVPVLQPLRLDDTAFLGALLGLRADLGVVAAYGKILTDDVLATPRLGLVNVHASLLPRYRGAAPVHRSVINGERETGVTIMRMVKALDAGPMLATTRRPIGLDDTSEEVERDLAGIGAALLIAIVDRLAAGPVPEVPQDESAATYARRITKADAPIDWTLTADAIHNLIRGLHPWPHAHTFQRDRRLILRRSTVMPDPTGSGLRTESSGMPDPIGSGLRTDVRRADLIRSADPTRSAGPAPGTILEADGDRLHVATGGGVLAITQIQAEGRRPMTPREFLAGHRLAAGEILSSHR